jgi:hypothetical protein
MFCVQIFGCETVLETFRRAQQEHETFHDLFIETTENFPPTEILPNRACPMVFRLASLPEGRFSEHDWHHAMISMKKKGRLPSLRSVIAQVDRRGFRNTFGTAGESAPGRSKSRERNPENTRNRYEDRASCI